MELCAHGNSWCVKPHVSKILLCMACSLSVEGAEAIADIVKRANLKELNLYMNDIGDAGILKVLLFSCLLCTRL